MKRKLLPTAAPKGVPPAFITMFIQHGWQRAERSYGKGTVKGYVQAIGAKRLAELRKRYLKGLKQ